MNQTIRVPSRKPALSALFAVISASLLAASPSALAAREGSIGNGGGAWVCREASGDIRWATIVDLFEAQNEFGLTLAAYPGSYAEIVDLVQARLFKANRDLYDAVSEYLEKVSYLKNSPPQITYTADDLQVVDDALYRLKPGARRCLGGTVSYEQVVNYKNDGKILVQSDLFTGKNGAGQPHLAEVARAALVYHEAIYAYRRKAASDENSVMSRRIVGLLFSTLSTDEFKKALEELCEGEIALTGMSFAKIPVGTFQMGSPMAELGRYEDETLHAVRIDQPFEMMKTEVTQRQWFRVMGTNPSDFAKYNQCPKTYIAPEKNKGVALCPNNPVESVSWDDVRQFLERLNQTKQDGYFYRLPTEAEWEYAERAGTQSAFYWIGDASQAFFYAWFNPNSGQMTHEVSSLKPNAWGLYDIAGNVLEWVSDYYARDYEKYPNGGPSSGSYRVLRGGSWNRSAGYLRSASRGSADPSGRYRNVGFRLARSR